MAYEQSKPATRQEPCPICGKTDHCWSAYYGPKSGWIYYCAEKHCSGSTIVHSSVNGKTYLLKNNRAFPGGRTANGYFVYESEEQQQRLREEYIAELKANNPNFKGYVRHNQKPALAQQDLPVEKELVEVDHVDPLSNKKLNEIYGYLLSMLVLEDNHKQALLDEWDAGLVNPHLGEDLLAKWPVRSLPMNDYARKNGGIRLKNMTRKELIKRLVDRFGSLRGVPGFYLETVKWKDKITGEPKEFTHWQMVNLSGIVYPCYDPDGNIYRLRIGDEHPRIYEYAKEPDGSYITEQKTVCLTTPDGTEVFKTITSHVHSAEIFWNPKTDEWFKKCISTGEVETIYSNQKGIYKVKISDKGYPVIDGKVDGKYKNFSSYYAKEVEQGDKRLLYNGYNSGCQSGSPISLFIQPGDDMRYLYITEGEKKGMVMNQFLHCPTGSMPGVHTFSKLFENVYGKNYSIMDYLIQRGLEAVIIVYDADKAVNMHVLSAEKGLIEKCKSYDVITFVGEWDPRYGKGADDILIQGKNFEFYQQ